MSETDAFGRQQDDDPLAAMGWSSDATTAATTATETDQVGHAARPPAQEELPASPLPFHIPNYDAAPPPRERVRTRTIDVRRQVRFVRRALLVAILAGAAAFVALVVVPAGSDVVDEIEQALDDVEVVAPPTPGGGDGPATPVPPDPPVGLQRRSLLLRGNLAPALDKLQKRAGGRLRLLRLAPDRMEAHVITRTRRQRVFQFRAGGEVAMLSDSASSAPSSQAGTIAWSQINPSAPRRIARRMLRGGRPSREIDYMVLLDAAGLKWSAFRTDGTGFIATADGKSVRRNGA